MCLQCGRPGFDPWVRKIPWRRETLPTPGFWSRELHGLYSPWGRKESDTTEQLSLSLGASLVDQMVNDVSAMRETRVCSLGWDDPLEKGNGYAGVTLGLSWFYLSLSLLFFFRFLNSSSFKRWPVHHFVSFGFTVLRVLCERSPHRRSLRCPPYNPGVALFHLCFSADYHLDFISAIRIQHRASTFPYFSFPLFSPPPTERKNLFIEA